MKVEKMTLTKEKVINMKTKICKMFLKDIRKNYPHLTLGDIEKSFDRWVEGEKEKGIIEMFLFPELNKLIGVE